MTKETEYQKQVYKEEQFMTEYREILTEIREYGVTEDLIDRLVEVVTIRQKELDENIDILIGDDE